MEYRKADNNNYEVAVRRYIFFYSSSFIAGLTLLASPCVLAMSMLSDASLSEVVGRDGLTIIVETPNAGWSADTIEWHTDVGGFDADGDGTISTAEEAYEAHLQYRNVTARSVDLTGATLGARPVTLTQTIDVGSEGNTPLLNYYIGVDRVRLQADAFRIPSQAGSRSFGTWALDAPMAMTVRNKGLFNNDYNKAYVRGEVGRSDPNTGEVLEYANLFYRQAAQPDAPYLTMHEFHALWEMPAGTLGIDSDGIVWRTGYGGDWQNIPANRTLTEGDLIHTALDFEYLYKDPSHHSGNQNFVITPEDRGLMHFGWLGSVKDAELHWRTGGTWYGTTPGPGDIDDIYDVSNKSGGLQLSASWGFVNRAEAAALGAPEREFRWRLGETSDICPGGVCAPGQNGSRINFELGDWSLWGTPNSRKPAAFHFPLISLDVVNGAEQGAGGLCWGFAYNGPAGTCSANGGEYIHLLPGHVGLGLGTEGTPQSSTGAVAIHIRDGQLQAFSRGVRLLELDAAGTTTETNFDWGLIYALANVDGSIYLYPGGLSSADNGLVADIMLMSQTLDENSPLQQGFNWDHGTHLLVADTNIDGSGVGQTRNAMGVGFLSSSFLLAANDTAISILEQSDPNDYYTGGLQFLSPATRFHYKATFGGGVLPDENGNYGLGPRIVQGALLDVNLEGSAGIRFSPSGPNGTWNAANGQYTGPLNNARNYLGYSAAFRLATLSNEGIEGDASSGEYGSYLLLAEPGRPDVAWRFANIEGNIAFTNGIIDLRGTNEDGDGKPKLVIANNMMIGSAATSALSDHFGSAISINPAVNPELKANLMLGESTLGTAVIPSATVYSSITLTPQ